MLVKYNKMNQETQFSALENRRVFNLDLKTFTLGRLHFTAVGSFFN